VPGLDEVPDELLDEEGIAVGVALDQALELGRDRRRAEQLADHGLTVLVGQPFQRHPLGVGLVEDGPHHGRAADAAQAGQVHLGVIGHVAPGPQVLGPVDEHQQDGRLGDRLHQH
jgi:hypothetical protein